MTNVVVTLVLAAIVGGAGLYIYKEKKRGAHCIGCPDSKVCAARRQAGAGCSGGCAGCSGCSGRQTDQS